MHHNNHPPHHQQIGSSQQNTSSSSSLLKILRKPFFWGGKNRKQKTHVESRKDATCESAKDTARLPWRGAQPCAFQAHFNCDYNTSNFTFCINNFQDTIQSSITLFLIITIFYQIQHSLLFFTIHTLFPTLHIIFNAQPIIHQIYFQNPTLSNLTNSTSQIYTKAKYNIYYSSNPINYIPIHKQTYQILNHLDNIHNIKATCYLNKQLHSHNNTRKSKSEMSSLGRYQVAQQANKQIRTIISHWKTLPRLHKILPRFIKVHSYSKS